MNQMEHNVKIKDYRRTIKPSPFVSYSRNLAYPPIFPNNLDQEKMLERFHKLHWRTDKLASLSTNDKMYSLRQEQNLIAECQQKQRSDVESHRLDHLQGIKNNIQTTRETFYRRTQLERPGAIEKQLGPGPLYKIVNDGKPIKF